MICIFQDEGTGSPVPQSSAASGSASAAAAAPAAAAPAAAAPVIVPAREELLFFACTFF